MNFGRLYRVMLVLTPIPYEKTLISDFLKGSMNSIKKTIQLSTYNVSFLFKESF